MSPFLPATHPPTIITPSNWTNHSVYTIYAVEKGFRGFVIKPRLRNPRLCSLSADTVYMIILWLLSASGWTKTTKPPIKWDGFGNKTDDKQMWRRRRLEQQLVSMVYQFQTCCSFKKSGATTHNECKSTYSKIDTFEKWRRFLSISWKLPHSETAQRRRGGVRTRADTRRLCSPKVSQSLSPWDVYTPRW